MPDDSPVVEVAILKDDVAARVGVVFLVVAFSQMSLDSDVGRLRSPVEVGEDGLVAPPVGGHLKKVNRINVRVRLPEFGDPPGWYLDHRDALSSPPEFQRSGARGKAAASFLTLEGSAGRLVAGAGGAKESAEVFVAHAAMIAEALSGGTSYSS